MRSHEDCVGGVGSGIFEQDHFQGVDAVILTILIGDDGIKCVCRVAEFYVEVVRQGSCGTTDEVSVLQNTHRNDPCIGMAGVRTV